MVDLLNTVFDQSKITIPPILSINAVCTEKKKQNTKISAFVIKWVYPSGK